MKSSSGIANGVILLKCKRLLYIIFILIHSQDILIYLLNHQNKFIKTSNAMLNQYTLIYILSYLYSVKCE